MELIAPEEELPHREFLDIEELITYLQTLPKDSHVTNGYGEAVRVTAYSDGAANNNFVDFD